MKKVRRYDIDWIRVLVFDILILFHVGMFFNTWDWHIKNNELVDWLRYPMGFTSQWRIPILFVVSGMGTRFALSYRTGGQYIKERFIRLYIPLLVGMLVIVPPQVYAERVVLGDFSGTYWAFLPHIFDGIYPSGNFSWHHLWFLPYLLFMSIAATPIFLQLRKENNWLIKKLRQSLFQSPFSLYLFVIPLIIVELSLGSLFPITHAFYNDFYALAFYFLLFISGFVLITIGESFWQTVDKIKSFALGIGLIGAVMILWSPNYYGNNFLLPIFKVINMWSWVLVIFGYSAKYLNKESQILKYRNEAVYPFYILHQTITILVGFWLMNSSIPILLKFTIMAMATFGGSWLLYEFLIKRVRFLRPLFGLRN
ncbi:MAG: acyltransferase family protein [Chitinophagales bacterium]